MSDSSSFRSTPRKRTANSNPTWRAQSLSKNSSPARLSFVLAEPEQGAPLASLKTKLPASVRSALYERENEDVEDTFSLNRSETTVKRNNMRLFRSVGPKFGRPASETGLVIDTSPPPSRRATYGAHLAYVAAQEHKKANTTQAKGKGKECNSCENEHVAAELPGQINGTLLNIPNNADSSVPAASSSDIATELPSSSTNIPPPTVIPITQPSTDILADTPCSQPHGKPISSPMASSSPASLDQLLNPGPADNTETQLSSNASKEGTSNQTSRAADEAAALSAPSQTSQPPKGSSTWFSTSWLGWPSPAPNTAQNLHDNRDNHGDLTHQRNDLNHDGHNSNDDIDSQDSQLRGSDDPKTQVDGADNATMSITRGNGNSRPSGQLTLTPVSHVRSEACPATSPPTGSGSTAVTTTTIAVPANVMSISTDAEEKTGTIQERNHPGNSQGQTTQLATATQATSINVTATATTSAPSWWDYVGWRTTAPIAAVDGMTPSASTSSGTCAGAPSASQSSSVGISPVADRLTGQQQTAELVSPTSPSPPLSGSPSSGTNDPRKQDQRAGTELLISSEPGERGGLDEGSRDGRSQGPDPAPVGDVDKAGSVETRGSSWFYPWSWHGAPNASPASAGEGGETEANEKSKKELACENVKEATTATSEPVTQELQISVVPPSASVAEVTEGEGNAGAVDVVPSVEVNPISGMIDSHRSSWISFFASKTSRTLVVKSITGPSVVSDTSVEGGAKVDENGMEVMDVDDEVDPPAPQVGKEQTTDSSKANEGSKEKESRLITSNLATSQGLVATLVRGRGRVRSSGKVEQDSPKDGNSDASSIRSVGGGPGSGTATPVNGNAIASKQGAEPAAAPALAVSTAGSIPSSLPSTTSLVKKTSLSLTGAPATPTNSAPTPTTTNTAKDGKDKKSKSVSPTPSPTSKKPSAPPPPNLVLPSWQETFHTAPRNVVPQPEAGTLTKTVQFVSGLLFSGGKSSRPRGGPSMFSRRGEGQGEAKVDKGKRRASSVEIQREQKFTHFGKALPRPWDLLAASQGDLNFKEDILRGCKRVVVIGVHGWFPGAVMRTVIGEPTGTSSKFANMMGQALEEFETEHGVKFDRITKIPLEGEGTIQCRVDKLYSNLQANQEWLDDIRAADAILVATHSQGSVVSTHLLDRLIENKLIRTPRNSFVTAPVSSFPAAAGMEVAQAAKPQRVCCLAMCGIHLGPLKYLSTSSLFQPYFQYLESPAARELFEFQNTDSEASKEYVRSLQNVLDNGVKMLYVASLNDQVVPIYSGIFTAASHPLILRALYIDGDAYNSSDFLANLLVLLLRILNSGIPDSGLIAHLSEATAGSLNGVGHSTVYEEIATYSLAVKYLFLTNDGLEQHPELVLDSFNARQEQNDYEIPWALRDVIADERVAHFFSKEIVQLRDAFREWHPRTSILRDLKRKLQPIQRLPASFATSRL